MKHLTKTFKTLLALIALTTIFTFSSCSEDNYHTDIINVDITGTNADSLYTVIINLHNSKMKLTKSGDEASAAGKYANVYDVKLLFLDENEIVIGEYYTSAFDNITANTRGASFKVPLKTKSVAAYCNTAQSPSRIVNSVTLGLSKQQLDSYTYFLPDQEDPIDAVGVYGYVKGLDISNNTTIDIVVEPIAARVEITSIKVNTLNSVNILPAYISLHGMYIYNIYDNGNIDKSVRSGFNDINDTNLYPRITEKASDDTTSVDYITYLDELPDFEYRYYDLGGVFKRSFFSQNNITVTPDNGVYGFQVLPAYNSVPNILIQIQLLYPSLSTYGADITQILFKYINVTSYTVYDSDTDSYIPLKEFDKSKVYKMAIEIDLDNLNSEPGVIDPTVSAIIKITEWDEVDVTPVL